MLISIKTTWRKGKYLQRLISQASLLSSSPVVRSCPKGITEIEEAELRAQGESAQGRAHSSACSPRGFFTQT